MKYRKAKPLSEPRRGVGGPEQFTDVERSYLLASIEGYRNAFGCKPRHTLNVCTKAVTSWGFVAAGRWIRTGVSGMKVIAWIPDDPSQITRRIRDSMNRCIRQFKKEHGRAPEAGICFLSRDGLTVQDIEFEPSPELLA